MQAQVESTADRVEGTRSAPFGRSHTLDFLRGLAIAGVMAIHVSQSFPSGYNVIDFVFGSGWVGVNVFYFVSAITMCLMWTQRAGEANPVRKFYIRRFLRIAPLFWLAIPLYLVVNGTGPSYTAPSGIGLRQVILTATFLHGFWPDAVNSVVPGDWSIAAEMMFYLVFPLVILSFGANRRSYLALALLLHLVNVCLFKPWAAVFFMDYYGPGHDVFVWGTLHWSFLNQLPVFLVGCALFFGLRDGFTKSDAAMLTGFVALSFAANQITISHEFNYLIINLVLGAFVYGCIRLKLHFAPLEAMGRNSYSMYLSHFAVIAGLHRIWPLADGLPSLLLAYACVAALSYLVSRATWYLVESRAQDLAHRLTSATVKSTPRADGIAAAQASS